MPVEAQKVVDRFKAKFGTIPLSKKRLDEIADKLGQRLPDDADDAAIDEELDFQNGLIAEGYFLHLQKGDDRIANEKHNKPPVRQQQTQTTGSNDQNTETQPNQPQQQQTTQPQQGSEKPKEQAQNSGMEAILQQLMQKMDGLSNEVQTMRQREQQMTIQQRAEGVLKDITSPAVKELALLTLPKTQDEFEPWSENITTKWKAIQKELGNPGGNIRPPSGGSSLPAMSDKAADDFAAGLLNKM